jgi:hypothetical protein
MPEIKYLSFGELNSFAEDEQLWLHVGRMGDLFNSNQIPSSANQPFSTGTSHNQRQRQETTSHTFDGCEWQIQ